MFNKCSISDPELQSFLSGVNNTDKDYQRNICLHHLFEKQVKKTPDSDALVFDDEKITYKELNTRSNMLAHKLRTMSVGPDVLVGVYMDRSIEMVVGLYAILKAGGAYVPLDPDYPKARLEYMMSEINMPVLLTQKKFFESITLNEVNIICLDDDYEVSEDHIENPDPGVFEDNLAYVIFTSGSTGKPKGVMVPHKGICNRILWMEDEYRLSEDDKILQKTPFSFDVSVWEFFWPLSKGATLVIAEPGGHLDTSYLLNIINEEKITVVHFVPSMLQIFLEDENIKQCKNLEKVFCSGEMLPFSLQQKFFENCDSRLHNLYGPTEASVDVTFWECQYDIGGNAVPIGKPIANTYTYILDKNLKHVSVGKSGELHIGGISLARGYLNRKDLTEEKFVSDPYSDDSNAKLYKTGDLARFSKDGNIEYIGRIDNQVKVRGFRIELGEVESVISLHPFVREAVTMAAPDLMGANRLVGYVVVNETAPPTVSELRRFLQEKLPDYMVPGVFMYLDKLPLMANGKVDRKLLPKPPNERPPLENEFISPSTELEQKLVDLLVPLIGHNNIGVQDNFFELGANSITMLQFVIDIQKTLAFQISIVKIFQYPSIFSLANYLEKGQNNLLFFSQKRKSKTHNTDKVAVIGMAGRFPGADNLEQFWNNLCNGIESISFFSDDDIDPDVDADIRSDPQYIKARGIIENADKFDAAFFGISPGEAKVMDPQQRVFLEIAWEAFENSGYNPDDFSGLIGCYASVGDNAYYYRNVLSRPDLVEMVGEFTAGYGNEKDYIATRVSHKLNLTGPALSINTGCSASMVAISTAFDSLRNHQCDMAIAGGVDIATPQKRGYIYEKEAVFCSDGHCRPFDSEATGTMFCDGAGAVILKRFDDALRDGDTIYSVICGTALNNDGSNKVSFLAPSVDGQAQVIAMAQANAGINPETISYVEAHGTATPLGDPIEVEALTKAFRLHTTKNQFCALGSLKGNVGHPTIAAGVAGLIKASLAVQTGQIPSTLHFKKSNKAIDFKNSPFYVNSELIDWPKNNYPRRAAVSSFGFGGTNAHLIIEEPPEEKITRSLKPKQLLFFSAKSDSALELLTEKWIDFLSNNKDINLADVAYTLQTGRKVFSHRRYVVCDNGLNGASFLKEKNIQWVGSSHGKTKTPDIVFMFPGQGAQYVNMGLNFYESEPVFRTTVDQCADWLAPHMGCDIRDYLYPQESDIEAMEKSLKDTCITQPAMFTIGYALAKLWISWGVKPSALIGHSVGEFVCACLAGVFSLKDALWIVAKRGLLMQELESGAMLSVMLSENDICDILPPDLSIAAVNGPKLCVVSGAVDSVKKFQIFIEDKGVVCRQLYTSHAFHSSMMDSIVEPFSGYVRKLKLSSPQIPILSTVTTHWMSDEQATDSLYWAEHLRKTVRFAEGVKTLWGENPELILLEVGPRTTTTTCAKQQAKDFRLQVAIPSLGDRCDDNYEWTAILNAVGKLLLNGVKVDWMSFYIAEERTKVPLPTYPFERKRYWVEPASLSDPKKSIQGKVNDSSIKSEIQRKDNNEDLHQIKTKLKRIMEDLSEVNYDSIDDNTTFFEMGIDSLLLTQIAFRIQKDFHIKVSFRELLREYSSVSLLSTFIEKQILLNLSTFEKQTDEEFSAIEETSLIPPDILSKDTSGDLVMQSMIDQIVLKQMKIISQLIALIGNKNSEVFSEVEQRAFKNLAEDEKIQYIALKQIDFVSEILEIGNIEKNKSELKSVSGETTIAGSSKLEIVKDAETKNRCDSINEPPVPGAKLGKDAKGNPAWFIEDRERPGKYLLIEDNN